LAGSWASGGEKRESGSLTRQKRLACTVTGSQLKEWPLSPELETLDQLLGGDLRLEVVARLFPSHEAFQRGIIGLLSSGDVVLVAQAEEIPSWRWKQLFSHELVPSETESISVKITAEGVRKIK
jgi:hypothetical protein